MRLRRGMTNGNDQAFASVGEGFNNSLYSAPGLTKREYFAAMAMQGLVASDTTHELGYEDAAKWAVKHADALIAALNTQGNPATTETKSDDDKAGE
jgi:hypothetical protein